MIDAINLLAFARLAMNSVRLFNVVNLLQILEPKTVVGMLVVAAARLMHRVFI